MSRKPRLRPGLSVAVAIGTAAVALGGTSATTVATNPTYDLSWTVTRATVPITDGTIKVGDELTVTVGASGTTVDGCQIYIATGAVEMEGPGELHDGLCSVSVILPEPSAWSHSDRESGDVCVLTSSYFGDGIARVLDPSDKLEPGGVDCGRRWGQHDVLDFAFDGTGTHRPFSSTPFRLSWDPTDWDANYQPLHFNTDWRLDFPAEVTDCQPYLNGSWQTAYIVRTPVPGTCPGWDLHLPGVLPTLMPWGGGPGDWNLQFVIGYGEGLQTIFSENVPFEASDGNFSSSYWAVAPTDLARARFVTAGERWKPTFQVSGAVETPTGCDVYIQPPGEDQVTHPGTIDSNGECTFDIAPFALGFWSQYSVQLRTAEHPGGVPSVTYGGTISAIEAPTAPAIPDPTVNADGTTTIAAAPGDGQGMSLSVQAIPESTNVAAATTASCKATSYTTAIETGGSLANARKRCALAPGDYLLKARMVDAAGKVTARQRTVTIAGQTDGSGVISASPAAVSAASRGQGLTFTYTAGPGGMSDGAITVAVPVGWSPPTKTGTSAGYVTASRGSVSIAGRTIIVSGLTRAAGETVSVIYGSRAGGGAGAVGPSSTGVQTWTSRQKATASGVFTALASSPKITVYAPDGSGSALAAPQFATHAQRTTLTFSYTAAPGGMKGGQLKLLVPTGWSVPSTAAGAAGYVLANTGTVTVSGRTITVSGLTRAAGQKVILTYGATSGGGPGARAPSATGRQVWLMTERSTAAGSLRALGTSPAVTVR